MTLPELSKEAVRIYLKEKRVIPVPENLPLEFLKRRAGVFVTIEEQGDLRGCIGTYLPTRENIAQETISNAIAAALEDYRFNPVELKDLANLSFGVSVLSKPEPVENIKELDPKKYGIIIKTTDGSYQKSALLLPDIDGVETTDQQISIVCRKGGIDPKKEKTIISRFVIEKYT